jgi:tetratricopeptide (TPR) repeat protein
VADHARRGGDLELAAASLRAAAARAAERFDHATAESLLDDALSLHGDAVGWLDRARVRTRRGRYAAAYEDVELARSLGARALEVGAWASYFDRRFDQAIAFATDGATIAEDDAVRARCLTVAGRTHHAAGDLATAERLLLSGAAGSTGSDRLMASAWLGVLRSHQSRPGEALALLRPATRPELSVEHTSAILHALLFTGHAHALSGHPAAALEAFGRYNEEVERRDVSRFQGRGKNFAGWVLRNIGAAAEGEEYHQEALAIAANLEGPETRVAALEDCAEARLIVGDIDAAADLLAKAKAALHGDLVFGWRLSFKLELLQARLAQAQEDPQSALDSARSLAVRARHLGVPRYAGVAGLVAHRASAALGEPVDLDDVEADLATVESSVELEAWWWIGEAAATHRVPLWVDRAATAAATLSGRAGRRGDALLMAAAPLLERWRTSADR